MNDDIAGWLIALLVLLAGLWSVLQVRRWWHGRESAEVVPESEKIQTISQAFKEQK